jgi:hypothetical protein
LKKKLKLGFRRIVGTPIRNTPDKDYKHYKMSQWINTMNNIKAEMNRFKADKREGWKGRVAFTTLAYKVLKKEWSRMVAARQVLDLKEWLHLDALSYCCDTLKGTGLSMEEISLVIVTWIHCAGYKEDIKVCVRYYHGDEGELRGELMVGEVLSSAPPSHEHPADEDPTNDLD